MKPDALQFRPGQYIFRENEASKSMFLIQKGSVAIRKIKPGGYVEIAHVYSGEVIGELSFFDRRPRSASAVALTEVEVLEITFDSLDKTYAKVPDYLKTIIASLAERLRRANDTIRRLQKEVVRETPVASSGDTFSATDALLAVQALIDIPDDIPAVDPLADKDPSKKDE
jgi:CRP/FNR family cyclic AMP-dependent transcriptional regulator